MERQSAEAHRDYRQSSEKFDYFMTGVSVAICGYLVQTFDANGLTGGDVVPKLEFASISLFLISIYFGIRRIEGVISGKRLNYSYLKEQEQIGDISRSAAAGETIMIDGAIANQATILAHIEECDERIKALKEKMNDSADKTLRNYKVRNALFMSGIAVQFAAKIVLGVT